MNISTHAQRATLAHAADASGAGPAAIPPTYRPELDSLRCYAVILVLLSHWTPAAFVASFNWGYAGVYLFFVISGYVITSGLLRDVGRGQRPSAIVGRFYLRRVLRIWPVYFLTCIVVFFVWPRIGAEYAPWHFAFASNVLVGKLGELVYPVHFWTLSVEQHFYLAWPLLLMAFGRRRLIAICLMCMVAAPLFRFVVLVKTQNLPLLVMSTPSNIDTIAAGCLLALLEHQDGRCGRWTLRRSLDRWCDIAGSVGLAALGVIVAQRLSGHPEAGFVLGASAVMFISLWLVRRAPDVGLVRRLLLNRATIAIGTVSYGVYIYHLFIGTALSRIVPDTTAPPVFAAAATALTLLTATASWFLVEKPILRLKAHLR